MAIKMSRPTSSAMPIASCSAHRRSGEGNEFGADFAGSLAISQLKLPCRPARVQILSNGGSGSCPDPFLVVPIERMDFALIRPLIDRRHQTVPDRIVSGIFPLRSVIFRCSHLHVPEIALPERLLAGFHFPGNSVLPIGDPSLKRFVRPGRAEEMEVIWQDDVFSRQPI